jgi:hypothetical protein
MHWIWHDAECLTTPGPAPSRPVRPRHPASPERYREGMNDAVFSAYDNKASALAVDLKRGSWRGEVTLKNATGLTAF